jgi:hypothetical protein
MMVDRLNGRASLALSAVGLLLVLLVGWFGVVSPQRSKAAELSDKVDVAETRLRIAQDIVRGPALRESTAQLAKLKTAIPDEVEMSEILRQLSRASAKSHVRLNGIAPSGATPTGATDAVLLSLTVEGSYFGLREFLRLLRSGAEMRGDQVKATGRLFGVDSIQFTGGDKDSLSATLAVTAFAFRPDAVGAAPGTETTTEGTVAEAARP